MSFIQKIIITLMCVNALPDAYNHWKGTLPPWLNITLFLCAIACLIDLLIDVWKVENKIKPPS